MTNSSGYSKTPLIKKLGYEPGDSVFALQAPEWFTDDLEKNNTKVTQKLPATWAHGFFMNQYMLEAFLNITDLSTIKNGLWVSWPKKAAKTNTDLTEQVSSAI